MKRDDTPGPTPVNLHKFSQSTLVKEAFVNISAFCFLVPMDLMDNQKVHETTIHEYEIWIPGWEHELLASLDQLQRTTQSFFDK